MEQISQYRNQLREAGLSEYEIERMIQEMQDEMLVERYRNLSLLLLLYSNLILLFLIPGSLFPCLFLFFLFQSLYSFLRMKKQMILEDNLTSRLSTRSFPFTSFCFSFLSYFLNVLFFSFSSL